MSTLAGLRVGRERAVGQPRCGSANLPRFMREFAIVIALWAGVFALTATGAHAHPNVPRFWKRVAQCETGGRWDWGALAGTPRARKAEGHLYEGGVGFYYATWMLWKAHVPVARRFQHAYQAPPWVQARVAAYGLSVGGYWGSLHNGCAG